MGGGEDQTTSSKPHPKTMNFYSDRFFRNLMVGATLLWCLGFGIQTYAIIRAIKKDQKTLIERRTQRP
jgi:hypothetical protein